MLTSFPDDDNVYAAIKGGAMGFLLKDSSAEYLLDAIRTVSSRGKRAPSDHRPQADAGSQTTVKAPANHRTA